MRQSDAAKRSENVIDENLRRVYEDTLQEGVPDRFRDLLAALKEQDREKGSLE